MAHHRISTLLAGILVALLLVGCTARPATDAASSSSATPGPGSPTPTATASAATSSSPTPSPRASPGDSLPLALVADPSLLALLPAEHAGVRFVGRDLAAGGPAPIDDELLRHVRDIAGGPAAAVSVAWIKADPAADDPTFGIHVVAVRVGGTTGMALRRAFVAASLLRPGASSLDALETLGKEVVVIGRLTLAYASGDALLVVTFADPPRAVPPGPTPTPNDWPLDTFFAALPASDPVAVPTQPPAPSVDPGLTSPVPDPSAATLLSAEVMGVPLRAAVTARGSSVLTNSILALPAYGLYLSGPSFDLDDVSAAAGTAEGLSTYVVIATRIPEASRRGLLAAWFNFVLERGGPVGEVEVIDVDGRLAQLYGGGGTQSQAVFVADGLLYWMAYLDLGDFPPPSPPPRPDLRDLVIDTVRNLPPIVDSES
ncbi:MAG: hypothetical protein HYX57_05950 [Chloroflexi bacterium]|nr:hypothetical protein [Chloroflexota bacterium]